MSDPLNRKPWPMKWVVVAIIACLVPYTWLTLHYRKVEPSFQPYEDTKQRANVLRLLDSGYQRISVDATRPAEPQELIRAMHGLAAISNAPSGVTEGLDVALVESPLLPVSYGTVSASAETAGLLPYPIVFTCKLTDQKHQLGGAQIYLRGESIVVVPQFEPLDGDLTARSKESPVAVTIPGGALKTGAYTVRLAGREQSKQWTLTVR
jgi:hypothetical protein